mgnify:CR=1 FL=1
MGAKSIFYKQKERRFSVSFMVMEFLAEKQECLMAKLQESKQISMKDVFVELFEFMEWPEPKDEDLLYLMARLEKGTTSEVDLPKKQGKSLKANKDFAGSFAEWIGGLKPDDLCLWLSGYDYDIARILYEETDIEDVRYLVNLKVEEELQKAKLGLEAALFGFGGGYKGSKRGGDANTVVHNMSDDASEAEFESAFAAAKSVGF